MKKAVLTCRVCGKEYEACRSARRSSDGVFRWQEVACSPECGAVYLERVMIARGETVDSDEPAAVQKQSTKRSKKKTEDESAAPAIAVEELDDAKE